MVLASCRQNHGLVNGPNQPINENTLETNGTTTTPQSSAQKVKTKSIHDSEYKYESEFAKWFPSESIDDYPDEIKNINGTGQSIPIEEQPSEIQPTTEPNQPQINGIEQEQNLTLDVKSHTIRKIIDIHIAIDASQSMSVIYKNLATHINSFLKNVKDADVRLGVTRFLGPRSQKYDFIQTIHEKLINADSKTFYNTLSDFTMDNKIHDRAFGAHRYYKEGTPVQFYRGFKRGDVRNFLFPTFAVSQMNQIEQSISKAKLHTSTVAKLESGLCDSLLGYQSVLKKPHAGFGFRPHADQFISILISDENAHKTGNCVDRIEKIEKKATGGCNCISKEKVERATTCNGNTGSGSTGSGFGLTCKKAMVPKWRKHCRSCPCQIVSSGKLYYQFKPSECQSTPVIYELEKYKGVTATRNLEDTVEKLNHFKENVTPWREFTPFFIGYTGEAGCAPDQSEQSVGKDYMDFINRFPNGKSFCIKSATKNILSEVNTISNKVTTVYPLSKNIKVKYVKIDDQKIDKSHYSLGFGKIRFPAKILHQKKKIQIFY